MDYTQVKSSNITHVGYDPVSSKLGVRFSSGKEYHYTGVRQDEFDSLVNAPSVGSHFAQHIRPNYTGVPL